VDKDFIMQRQIYDLARNLRRFLNIVLVILILAFIGTLIQGYLMVTQMEGNNALTKLIFFVMGLLEFILIVIIHGIQMDVPRVAYPEIKSKSLE
jgi:TRAP-type C4-dicarboxylate transport system permease small subunit